MNFRIKLLMFLLPAVFLSGIIVSQIAPASVKWMNGKKYLPYQIQPKDTWTGIARLHEIPIKELQGANAGVTDLKIGQVIYVPAKVEKGVTPSVMPVQEVKQVPKKVETPAPGVAPVQAVKQMPKKESFVYHTVKQGETLYHISKLYNQPVAEIMKWNNLTSNSISPGNNLIVGKVDGKEDEKKVATPVVIKEDVKKAAGAVKEDEKKVAGAVVVKEDVKKSGAVKEGEVKSTVVTEEKKNTANDVKNDAATKDVQAETKADNLEKTETKPADNTTETPNKDFPPGTVEKITETGVATWLNDQELNQNKFYALHRTAPIGTIIKVTNRMTNNSVFVKVVGLLPDTGDNTNIIIKITSAAAQRIGAIDLKFTAELSYGVSH